MIALTLALIALAAVQALTFSAILHRQSRAHARREDLLLNQLLHAVGTPWQPAPAIEEWRDRADAAKADREQYEHRYTLNPEEL